MPPLGNLLFELVSFALGIIILYTLWRDQNKFHFVGFIIALIMTLTVELFGVREANSYFYSEYLVVVQQIDPAVVAFFGGTGRDVPLFIGIDWAVIVFCLWRLGERLMVKWYLLPLVFGLVAVIMDLALDPIASGSRIVPALGDPCITSAVLGATEGAGYWVWCIPDTPSEFWFGVPVANFYGWFLVIATFMLFYLAAHKYAYTQSLGVQIATLLSAMAASLVVFFSVLHWFLQIDVGASGWIILAVLMLAGVAVIFMAGLNRTTYTIDWWPIALVGGNVALCGFTYVSQLYGLVSASLVIYVAIALAVGLVLVVWLLIGKRLFGIP